MQVLTIQSKEQNALVSDRICFLTPTLSTEIKKVEGYEDAMRTIVPKQ
jgi:hypothetical protein